jgi:hypothetical protein
MNPSRESFERWLPTVSDSSLARRVLAEGIGDYSTRGTQLAWLAYQAAHAEAGRGMGEVVGILQELVDYPNETSVSDCERALWAEARALLARLKKGEL